MWVTLWQWDWQIQVSCWPTRLLCTKGARRWWKVKSALQQTWEGAWGPPWAGPQDPFPASQHQKEVYSFPVQHMTQLEVRASPSPKAVTQLTQFFHFSLHLIVRLIYLPEVIGLTVGSCYLSLLWCTHLGYSSEDLKDHGWKCVLSHILN